MHLQPPGAGDRELYIDLTLAADRQSIGSCTLAAARGRSSRSFTLAAAMGGRSGVVHKILATTMGGRSRVAHSAIRGGRAGVVHQHPPGAAGRELYFSEKCLKHGIYFLDIS